MWIRSPFRTSEVMQVEVDDKFDEVQLERSGSEGGSNYIGRSSDGREGVNCCRHRFISH